MAHAAQAQRSDDPIVIWAPQAGPQTAYVTCPIEEVFYGGARGGGKTDGSLGDWINHAHRYGEHAKGIFFRRTYKQLEDTINRTKELMGKLGGVWNESRAHMTLPNGARLLFRHLERDKDAELYQGHSYTRVYIEELTNFPSPKPVNKLKATLRSAHGVPCGFRATGNPGGAGHTWVKARYIDPAPQGYEILTEEVEGLEGETLTARRVFIPAKLRDNPKLLESDPFYVARLRQAGSENLVKAWLQGDWSIVEGAFFDCWSDRMVIKPFKVPEHWAVFGSFDWGSASPFSYGLWAVASEEYKGIPKGAMVRIREWYGAKLQEDEYVGLKMGNAEIAAGILSLEGVLNVRKRVADPSIFSEEGGPSIAEQMQDKDEDRKPRGVVFRKADNKRIPGWTQMRNRMMGDPRDNNRPMIYCFNTCTHSIRTIPTLLHDDLKPEDLDTEAEDHVADEWRYACQSRPWARPMPREEALDHRGIENVTFDEAMKMWDSPQGEGRI